MALQILKVSECYESGTNPRGTDFAGKQFDELVASITEKGVLVPVLARKRESTKNDGLFEVIAGNRRLRAAWTAGLKEIPAQLVEMTDDEAREAQIVENLQRQDVHPLEEGEAYRQLIEDGGKTVKDVAVKVGKSESYIRQRLFLTNLSPKSQKFYRGGEWPDSLMALVAKLSPKNQDTLIDKIGGQNYDLADLKEYIQEHFSDALANQPWLKDASIAKIVGPCKECPPNRAALFGNIKDGQCTDLRCWERKMKRYFDSVVEQDPETVLISSSYGKPDRANVLSKSQYELIGNKKKCDFAAKGLMVDGSFIGKTIPICFDKACKEHRSNDSEYAPSGKEMAKRKKEREQDEARREKFDAAIAESLLRVKWPLSEKHLDALFELTLESNGATRLQPILKRYDLKADKVVHKDYSTRDFAAPIRRLATGNDEKLRFIFEILLPTYWSHSDDKEMK